MIAMKNVLVATDFSEPSATALTYARELARKFGAQLHILHVVQDVTALIYADASIALSPPNDWQADLERECQQTLDRLVTAEDRRDLHAQTVLVTSNNPAKAITDHGRDSGMDLIVIGATGRGRVSRLMMGSVADKVIRTAFCPVLTVHHPEHEFVVPDSSRQPERAR